MSPASAWSAFNIYAPYQINLEDTRGVPFSGTKGAVNPTHFNGRVWRTISLWSTHVIGREAGDFDVIFGESIGVSVPEWDDSASCRWETFRQSFNHGLYYIKRANFSISRYKTILILKGAYWGDCDSCKKLKKSSLTGSCQTGKLQWSIEEWNHIGWKDLRERMGILDGQSNHWEGRITNQVLTSTATRILPPPISISPNNPWGTP